MQGPKGLQQASWPQAFAAVKAGLAGKPGRQVQGALAAAGKLREEYGAAGEASHQELTICCDDMWDLCRS